MADEQMFAPADQTSDGGPQLQDYRRLTRLYCMNGGYHLQILPDGLVQGQRDERDAHNVRYTSGLIQSHLKVIQKFSCWRTFDLQLSLSFLSLGTVLKLKAVDRGVVVIQGTEAKRYLAMSDEGRLYGSPTVTDECYFLEKLEENYYNTYQPQKYQDNNWYVALKKNGKPKLGPRTHIGQKAVFFIPRQLGGSQD